MRKLGSHVKEEIENNPYYRKCARADMFNDHDCRGRITMEHALIYAGRQIDEIFAVIPLCAYSHSVDEFQDGGILNKEKNEYIAISRMTEEDKQKYPRFNWNQRFSYLTKKYGKPETIKEKSNFSER